jgi:predicted ribosome quality control (RQC) complex YloA/Tae2 family protein
MKIASPQDLWFHTQKIPGSHVVVKTQGKEVDEKTILEAAYLAAFYSKARNSSKIPVDYTEKRYVRKPTGAKPGFVIYENFKTIIVDPNQDSADLVRRDS